MSDDPRHKKQLHVWIPKQLHDEIKSKLPESGMISTVVRRLLREWLAKINEPGDIYRRDL